MCDFLSLFRQGQRARGPAGGRGVALDVMMEDPARFRSSLFAGIATPFASTRNLAGVVKSWRCYENGKIVLLT